MQGHVLESGRSTRLKAGAVPATSVRGESAGSKDAGGNLALFRLPSQPDLAGGIGAGGGIEVAAITAD